MATLGDRYPYVHAILCVSAHWNTSRTAVNAKEAPETIYDFAGSPMNSTGCAMTQGGSLDLAGRVADLVYDAGLSCDLNRHRGLDHSAWVPLMLMFPNADVPVVQLSIQRHFDPAQHIALGAAISPLRDDGVLILGSGGAVHPLGYAGASLGEGAPTDEWACAFGSWLTDAVTRGDHLSLVKYHERGPYAEIAHPYPDHFKPLLVAFGAAGDDARGMALLTAGTGATWAWMHLRLTLIDLDAPSAVLRSTPEF